LPLVGCGGVAGGVDGVARSVDIERSPGFAHEAELGRTVAAARMNERWHRFAFRGLHRVRLHADLTIVAKLACTLARAGPPPAP